VEWEMHVRPEIDVVQVIHGRLGFYEGLLIRERLEIYEVREIHERREICEVPGLHGRLEILCGRLEGGGEVEGDACEA